MKKNDQIPEVIFADDNTKSYIEKWLGEFETDIEQKFGELLKEVGVDSDDTCTLLKQQIINDVYLINCHFENSDKNASISLTNLSNKEGAFVMVNNNCAKMYEYVKKTENSESILKIETVALKNPNTGVETVHSCSDMSYRGSTSNRNNTALIEIRYPQSLNDQKDLSFLNIEELDNMLIRDDLVIQLKNVYEIIKNNSYEELTNYPKLSIKIVENNTNSIIDSIEYNYGRISEIVQKRNGITITIDKANNWSYDAEGLHISKKNNGEVDYRLNLKPGQYSLGVMPMEQIANAGVVVNDVKKMIKSIF